MFARNHFACEYGSWRELARPGIELHTDIGSNHRPENGEVVLVVHTKEHEEQRLCLACHSRQAARSYSPAKQEQSAGDQCSSHFARNERPMRLAPWR
jgi:hypothetical protein